MRSAFAHACQVGRHIIVEQFLKGRDYRVLVTGSKVAAASWRRPPHVTGDGRSNIRQLVESENGNPARGALPQAERLHCRRDVLVFGCGSSLSELIEAIHPELPRVAEKITT